VTDSVYALPTVLHVDLLLELVMATVLGGLIGLERELKGKPAGLRTNILICIGAACFTHLSLQIGSGSGDPGRVAAQILTGVGFIGAGTIMQSRGSVTGLTSAATIWVVTAIGMDLGTRQYGEALATTAVVMVVLAVLGRAETALERRACHGHVTIRARREPSPVEELRALVGRLRLEIVASKVRREDDEIVLELDLRGRKDAQEEALVALAQHAAVRSVAAGE
jgi:putative Mg2+ transporter-C (MgtC) family protein